MAETRPSFAAPKAMVERDGKLEVSGGVRFGLRDASEYVPYIIQVRMNVGTSGVQFNGDIKSLNNALNVKGTLEAPVPLENVFIVLDLSLNSGKAFFLWGVGDLKAGVPADFEIHVPTSVEMGPGNYQFHVFTDGAELLNSMMDSMYIQNQLEALVRRKIDGVQEEALGVLVHPSPIFPSALKNKNAKGKVMISVRITRFGYVVDASVKSATGPAFGQAALVAVRQWQFLPPIKNGVPSGLAFDVPVNFN